MSDIQRTVAVGPDEVVEIVVTDNAKFIVQRYAADPFNGWEEMFDIRKWFARPARGFVPSTNGSRIPRSVLERMVPALAKMLEAKK